MKTNPPIEVDPEIRSGAPVFRGTRGPGQSLFEYLECFPTVRREDAEVIDLIGHPKAKRCNAWSYDEPEQFITILELPPVDAAQAAVKVGVAYQVKQARKASGKK